MVFLFIVKVGSNAGIIGMTKEHLGLALALNVPVFVVVTKIDMCPANILQGNANLSLSYFPVSSFDGRIWFAHYAFVCCRDTKVITEATEVSRMPKNSSFGAKQR